MPTKKKEITPQTESNPEMDAMRNSVEETHSTVPEVMPSKTESDAMPEYTLSSESPAIGQTDPEPPPDEIMTCMNPDPDTKMSDILQTDADPPTEDVPSVENPDPGDVPSEDVQTEPEEKKPRRRGFFSSGSVWTSSDGTSPGSGFSTEGTSSVGGSASVWRMSDIFVSGSGFMHVIISSGGGSGSV